MRLDGTTFATRHDRLSEALASRRDPQERLAWLVELARQEPSLEPSLRIDTWLVPGCASRLWLVCREDARRCRYACDSDSAIQKALVGLLCRLYDGLPPEEILHGEPDFLADAPFLRNLTENRRRTLARARERIRDFARMLHGSQPP